MADQKGYSNLKYKRKQYLETRQPITLLKRSSEY